MTLFDWPIPQTPSFVKILGLILNSSCVIVIFVWHFKIFVTTATGVGLTPVSLTQLNWQTPKTPFGARILISHTQAEL